MRTEVVQLKEFHSSLKVSLTVAESTAGVLRDKLDVAERELKEVKASELKARAQRALAAQSQ